MEQILVRLKNSLFVRLNEHCPDGTRAEFIREAIEEKLNRKIISQNETYNRIKKLDHLDTKSLHQALADLLSTAHVIFSEQMIHRELLKTIHRRGTITMQLDKLIIEHLTDKVTSKQSYLSSKAMVKNEQQQLNIYVEEEIPAK